MGLSQGLLQLEQIFISNCNEMEEIIVVENVKTTNKVVLPRLRSLGLHKLSKLSSLCQGVLLLECPSLEEIGISECPNLKRLSLCMDNVTKLKKIQAKEEWLEGLEYDENVNQQLHQLLEMPSEDPSRMQFPISIHALAIKKNLENLSSIVAGIWSEDSSLQLEAITESGKLLAVERNPLIEEVIQSGVVPRFVEFLMRDDFPQLQFEAVATLTNIVYGTSENTNVVIDHGAVPIFVKLLGSPNDKLREQVVLALGNVAGDSPRCRDIVLGHGALLPLLAQLNEHAKRSMMRKATWALSNFCRGKPQPPFEQIKPALPTLKLLLHSNDKTVLRSACLTLSYLSKTTRGKIQVIIEADVSPRLIELLLDPSPSIINPALNIIGNITSSSDDTQTQYIINHQALPCLLNLLSHNHKKTKMNACWVISNITAGNKDQIQAVIETGIIGPLVHLLQTAEFPIKKEAAWAISNAISGGTHNQIKYLLSQGCTKPLSDLLVCPDLTIVSICLDGLENILKVGEAEKSLGNIGGVNLYAQLIDDVKGLEKTKKLESHDNKEINEKAMKILKTYWLEEDDKSLPPGDANATAQPGSSFEGNTLAVPSGGFNFS